MSPKKDPPRSAKKSLTRLVLVSNAVKSQKKLELVTETVAEKSLPEKIIECTPMKSSIPADLMDVTISPIASKSILQSSNESVFYESKADNNDFGLKSLPAFTMNETKFGKSILNSYESSIAETSRTTDQTKGDSLVKDLKSLPAFTIGESMFCQSVLHSYQSSIDETGVLDIEDKDRADKTDKDKADKDIKTCIPTSTSNVTGTDKSVFDNSVDDSKAILASLLTSDSDIEMKEDDNEATIKEDNEAVIQKEKEKIVEIEREIHEIEKDISDEEYNVSNDSGEDDPMMEVSEESEEEGDEEDSEEEEEEEDADDEEEEEESLSENESEGVVSLSFIMLVYIILVHSVQTNVVRCMIPCQMVIDNLKSVDG